MRCLTFLLLALAPACSAVRISPSVDSLVGSYRREHAPPEQWQELILNAGGSCTWQSCTNGGGFLRRLSAAGSWRIDGSELVVSLEDGREEQLVVRRWRDYDYLVPSSGLAWFESHGPDPEAVFFEGGAPLAEPPPYFLPASKAG